MVPLMCVMCRSSRLIETNGRSRETKLETTEIQKEAVRAPSAETQRLLSGLPQRHESRLATVTVRCIYGQCLQTHCLYVLAAFGEMSLRPTWSRARQVLSFEMGFVRGFQGGRAQAGTATVRF